MTYQDQVLALFGEANPVSDVDTLEDLMSPRLEVVEQRTGDMTDTKIRGVDPNTPTSNDRRRRGLAYALAGAVGVLIVGAASWIMLAGEPEPDVASTAVAVGRSFVEARDAWDADATVALLAPDAVIDDLEVPWAGDYHEQYRWYEAVDWRWAVGECTEDVPGPATTVTCSYTMENAWSRALEVGPITGSIEFVVADGQIVELTHNASKGFNLDDFDPVWGAFREWVGENHPDDLSVMYSSSAPSYTPESMALWEQYTDEFVSSAGN